MSAAAKIAPRPVAKEPVNPATSPAENQAVPEKGAPDAAAALKLESANLHLLGQVTWLMSLSPAHKHLFIADMDWRVRPPILLRQCRMFMREQRPFAFVTWAYVTDEVAGRLQATPGRLRPAEWQCGPRPVIVDVVAPHGDAEGVVREVVKSVFEKKATGTDSKPAAVT